MKSFLSTLVKYFNSSSVTTLQIFIIVYPSLSYFFKLWDPQLCHLVLEVQNHILLNLCPLQD